MIFFTNFIYLFTTYGPLFYSFAGLLKEFKKLEKICLEKMTELEKIFNVDFAKEKLNPLTQIFAKKLMAKELAELESPAGRAKSIEIVKLKKKAERGKTRMREICQNIFNLCQFLMPLNMLQRSKKKLMSRKSYMKRMRNCISKVDNDAFNEEVKRKELETQHLTENGLFSFSEFLN